MAPSENTEPTRVMIIGTTGAGLSSLLVFLEHEFDITPTDASPYEVSMSCAGRRYGKSNQFHERLIEYAIHSVESARLPEELYIFNPHLQRHFIGPITRQLVTRSRPSIVRKRASRHDKLINKRKTWLKQLQS